MPIIPDPRNSTPDDTRRADVPTSAAEHDPTLPTVESHNGAVVAVFPAGCDWPQAMRDRFVVELRTEIRLSLAKRRPALDLPAPTATAARMLAGAR